MFGWRRLLEIPGEESRRMICEFGLLEKGLGWRWKKKRGCYWQMDGAWSHKSGRGHQRSEHGYKRQEDHNTVVTQVLKLTGEVGNQEIIVSPIQMKKVYVRGRSDQVGRMLLISWIRRGLRITIKSLMTARFQWSVRVKNWPERFKTRKGLIAGN